MSTKFVDYSVATMGILATFIIVLGSCQGPKLSNQNNEEDDNTIGNITFSYSIQDYVPDSLEYKIENYVIAETKAMATKKSLTGDDTHQIYEDAVKLFSNACEGLRATDSDHPNEADFFIIPEHMTVQQKAIFERLKIKNQPMLKK
jgi:hypothetical protein